MIVFKCEACGTNLRVQDTQAGKKGKCPKCGATITIPASHEPRAAGPALHQEGMACSVVSPPSQQVSSADPKPFEQPAGPVSPPSQAEPSSGRQQNTGPEPVAIGCLLVALIVFAVGIGFLFLRPAGWGIPGIVCFLIMALGAAGIGATWKNALGLVDTPPAKSPPNTEGQPGPGGGAESHHNMEDGGRLK